MRNDYAFTPHWAKALKKSERVIYNRALDVALKECRSLGRLLNRDYRLEAERCYQLATEIKRHKVRP